MRATAFAMSIAIAVASIASGTEAHAQPGSTAPTTPPVLTPHERALLARGEISGERRVLGAVGSAIPGFGLGHAIEGRWLERGWIFTFGEIVCVALAAVASSESDLDENLTAVMGVVGGAGVLVLRVWEVVDAIRGPSRHNRRVREIRAKAGFGHRSARVTLQPFVLLNSESVGRGGIAGITVRF